MAYPTTFSDCSNRVKFFESQSIFSEISKLGFELDSVTNKAVIRAVKFERAALRAAVWAVVWAAGEGSGPGTALTTALSTLSLGSH